MGRYQASAMGVTSAAYWLLSAETNGWTKETESGATTRAGHLSAVAYFYPTAGGAFFLRGGAGFATLRAAGPLGGSGADYGISVSVGVGYDFGFGRSFALTPFANFLYGATGDGSSNLLQLGVGVNWY